MVADRLPDWLRSNLDLVGVGIVLYAVPFVLGVVLTTQLDVTAGLSAESVASRNPIPDGEITFWSIFANNVRVWAFLVLGAFMLGFVTVVNLMINGFTLGTILGGVVATGGLPLGGVLLSVVPHSVFELPAMWVAGAAGLTVPRGVVRYVLDRQENVVETDAVVEFALLSVAAMVLFLVGAWVEANVTVSLIETFYG